MWKYKIDFNMKTLLSYFNFEIENVYGFHGGYKMRTSGTLGTT
jgi:hypothetical protein